MINDPESASKEEWDTYAWFGFAIQEAQSLERILLEIAVALDMQEETLRSHEDHRLSLYDKFGRWTLGQLLSRVRMHADFPDDLAANLEKAVDIRNNLAHAFFWPKDLENDTRTEQAAQAELMVRQVFLKSFSVLKSACGVCLKIYESIRKQPRIGPSCC